ncbi:rubrerythrin [Tepiditoga spiralis]|uniref:Rubrerythrin n=1 Tax=Tepiditoga spiralis TaxID=2108365 RepID=A0A7G1G4Y5_9BACT|nr:rubrerythrin family protein [Tepiditoga spiralis]BBE31165.1 rubrerythrin [Tepiditoga spiralis]
MKGLKGTETEKNLLKSFAGESQAKNRYTFFAKTAKKEGYEQISAIFQETALNEEQHAKTFFKFLEGGDVEITATYPAGKIGTTVENLKAAAAGEHEEFTELYPMFAEIAEKEGFKEIASKYRAIAKVEEAHEKRYLKLLKNIEENKVFEKDAVCIWKCRKCGYIHEGTSAPVVCPACGHPQGYFELKEYNY